MIDEKTPIFFIKVENKREWIRCITYFHEKQGIKWDGEIIGKIRRITYHDEDYIKLNLFDEDETNFIVITPCEFKKTKDKICIKFYRIFTISDFEEGIIPLKMLMKRDLILK